MQSAQGSEFRPVSTEGLGTASQTSTSQTSTTSTTSRGRTISFSLSDKLRGLAAKVSQGCSRAFARVKAFFNGTNPSINESILDPIEKYEDLAQETNIPRADTHESTRSSPQAANTHTTEAPPPYEDPRSNERVQANTAGIHKLTTEQAKAQLQGHPPGSFLLRESQQGVIEVVVQHGNGRFGNYHYVNTPTNQGNLFVPHFRNVNGRLQPLEPGSQGYAAFRTPADMAGHFNQLKNRPQAPPQQAQTQPAFQQQISVNSGNVYRLSPEQAKAQLQGHPPGSFLLRESQPGVIEVVVKHDHGRFGNCVYVNTPTNQGNLFVPHFRNVNGLLQPLEPGSQGYAVFRTPADLARHFDQLKNQSSRPQVPPQQAQANPAFVQAARPQQQQANIGHMTKKMAQESMSGQSPGNYVFTQNEAGVVTLTLREFDGIEQHDCQWNPQTQKFSVTIDGYRQEGSIDQLNSVLEGRKYYLSSLVGKNERAFKVGDFPPGSFLFDRVSEERMMISILANDGTVKHTLCERNSQTGTFTLKIGNQKHSFSFQGLQDYLNSQIQRLSPKQMQQRKLMQAKSDFLNKAYDLQGIPQGERNMNLTFTECDKLYKKICLKNHPDKDSNTNEEAFKEFTLLWTSVREVANSDLVAADQLLSGQ